MQLFVYLFALRVGGEDQHKTYLHKEKKSEEQTFEMLWFSSAAETRKDIARHGNMGIHRGNIPQ